MTDVASAIDSRTVATAYRVQALGVSLAGVEGRRTVLRDVTFDVACGEIVAVVGRSGTGKTTLLRVLAGLLGATTGTVILRGAPLREPPEGVVMVFQDYQNALLPWRTVARNVAIGLERRSDGGSASRRRPRVGERGTAPGGAGIPGACPVAWRSACSSPAHWSWSQRCC